MKKQAPKNLKIVAHRKKIDDLFEKISSIPNSADKSEWSKYLCVLVSGYIEESLRVLLEAYCENRASDTIQNFVSKHISRVTNCNTQRIEEILGSFDKTLKNNFTEQIVANSEIKDEIKNSIDSIIANRHSIVHGRSVGISYAQVLKYYENVKKAVEILEIIIKKTHHIN